MMNNETRLKASRRSASLALAGVVATFTVGDAFAQEGPTISAIMDNGTLRAGVAIAAPGLMQDPANGTYIGPSVTITEAVAQRIGVDVEYVDSSWDAIIAGLQANSFDIAIAPLYATPARLEVVDVIDYYLDGVCYIVRGDNPELEGVDSYDAMASLALDFALVAGASYNNQIEEKYTNFVYSTVAVPAGGTLATEAVLSGRADATVVDASQAQRIVARFPDLRVVPSPEDCIASPDFASPVGVAVRKDDPAFTQLIIDVVGELESVIEEEILLYTSPEFTIRN